MVDQPTLLLMPEAAKILNVSVFRAYSMARLGLLPVVRLGRQIRVDPEKLRDWIAGGGSVSLEDQEAARALPPISLRFGADK